MRISFVGFGTIAQAIAQILTKDPAHKISAAAPSLSIGRNQEGIATHYDNIQIIKDAEVIILAVKPHQMNKVLDEIKPHIPVDSLLISVAAGLSLNWFASRLSRHALIRAMPNTPIAVGLGVIPMIANSEVNEDQRYCAERLFKPLGLTHWVSDEEEMDTFTALSGSGPAYFYSFIEALTYAGISLGLSPSIAHTYALQTGVGALQLAQNSSLNISDLRTQVTSQKGTTAAALEVLHEPLKDLIFRAMSAAKARAQELGQLI